MCVYVYVCVPIGWMPARRTHSQPVGRDRDIPQANQPCKHQSSQNGSANAGF